MASTELNPTFVESSLESAFAFLYGIVALLAARALAAVVRDNAMSPAPAGPLPSAAGIRSRRWLMSLLVAANGVRCLALVASVVLQHYITASMTERWPGQLEWLIDLLLVLPTVLFLSVFSVLALFWAKVHYTVRMEPMPMLDTAGLGINIGGYVLVIVIAVCTFALQAWDFLLQYLLCVIGFFQRCCGIRFGLLWLYGGVRPVGIGTEKITW
jgi:hypothetical protein